MTKIFKKQFSIYGLDETIANILESHAKKYNMTRNQLIVNILSEIAQDLKIAERLEIDGVYLTDRVLFVDRYFYHRKR